MRYSFTCLSVIFGGVILGGMAGVGAGSGISDLGIDFLPQRLTTSLSTIVGGFFGGLMGRFTGPC